MIELSPTFSKDPAPQLFTITGEPYQPARIYYQVERKNAVLGRFKRLRCINFNPDRNCWVWFYNEEAKNLAFEQSYRDIPKEYRPIVLGYFTWNGEHELRLDVRSFDRAIEAIQFFAYKINRSLAKVTSIKIVNQFFPTTLTEEEILSHPTKFFEKYEAVNPAKQNMLMMFKSIESQYETEDERKEAFFAYVEKEMKKTLPKVEELPVHFYEDGIESITMSLHTRILQITEHWKGNKSFSYYDLMERYLERLEDEE